MNVLSLFDGMSCGQIALNRVGIKVDNYYAAEIDKFAIKVTQKNYPNTTQLGDVTEVKSSDLPKIDLLIGGSPCQGFSFAGKQLNFNDPRSKLFFEYVRLLEECEPTYFFLENVKMKKEYQDTISKYMGVEPIEINSSLVSAQNRRRLYWTNIPGVVHPEDKEIHWSSVSEYNAENVYYLTDKMKAWVNKTTKRSLSHKIYELDEETKMQMLEASHYKSVSNQRNFSIQDKAGRRYISVIECERLQTVPDNYTKGVSNTQRYKMLGNGWTVDVVAHFFKNIGKPAVIPVFKQESEPNYLF